MFRASVTPHQMSWPGKWQNDFGRNEVVLWFAGVYAVYSQAGFFRGPVSSFRKLQDPTSPNLLAWHGSLVWTFALIFRLAQSFFFFSSSRRLCPMDNKDLGYRVHCILLLFTFHFSLFLLLLPDLFVQFCSYILYHSVNEYTKPDALWTSDKSHCRKLYLTHTSLISCV